ncbi:heterokaryon incompatibility (HET) domain protein [Fusarium sp. NRRL 25303]|nr:heterokaryon incompatibility (HET) domain protein [Fusarium sp. NRRL 25303]
MSLFRYRPLSTPRSIRLLSIAEVENSGGSVLTCYLTEVSLDSPILDYRALSYTWGDPARTTRILVNGEWLVCACQKESEIPVPLDHQFTFPTLLWVDAICINQDDPVERAQQVALMQQIYSRASSVLVWLGRATEQTVPAFRLLLGLAELSRSTPEDQKDYIAHVIRDEYFKGHWLALGELLQREWWYRVWTIQEVVLGSGIHVVCGSFVVEWSLIRKAIAVFQLGCHYMDEMMEATVFSETYHYFFPLQKGAYRISVIDRLKADTRQNRDTRSSKRPSVGTYLADLLDKTRDYDATDPRDKVYAIIGLLNQSGYKSPIMVSYQITVEDLYIQVAKVIQQGSETLDIMSQVEVKPLTHQDIRSGLPSWVPNWTVRSTYKSRYGNAQYPRSKQPDSGTPGDLKSSFSFTGDSKAHCRFLSNKSQMVVEGFTFDTIAKIETRFVDLEPGIKLEGVKRYGYRIGWKPPSACDQFECHDYWLDWLGFHADFPSPAAKIPRRNGGDIRRVDTRVFKTQVSGVLGSTDVSIRVGDSICVLMGARVPYILRPCGNSWVLVGPCILLDRGIINGVLMKGLGVRKFTLQDFIIE